MQLKPAAAKYSIPSLPTIIRRKRLIAHLDAHKSQPLMMIVGQAAQGKSTLVADYLLRQTAPVAWLNLDAADHTAAGFYRLLVYALRQAFPGKRWAPPGKPPDLTETHEADVTPWLGLLQTLWQKLSGPLHLVLDGLERLALDAPAWHLIHQMCASAEHTRLFLISRQLPPFKFRHWAVQQRLWVVGNDELAFDTDEITALFSTLRGVNLSAERSDYIRQVTDGWPGGLILLLQALNRRPESQWDVFLAQGLPAALIDETRPYFTEAIVSQLPSEIKSGLVRSAIFETIDPEILTALGDEVLNPALLDTLMGSPATVTIPCFGTI